MQNLKTTLFYTFILTIILSSCGNIGNGKKDGFNIFPVSEDVKLGKQVSDDIASKPGEYPVLDPNQHKEVYNYINSIRDEILNSGKVQYKDEFVWNMKIINNDSVLNAFCTPGGYIYIYTGLIKYLDGEDELAGVIGHEMGHADLRHSTRQMTQMYGVNILASAVLGDREALKQITSGLVGLTFSRSHEKEADNASVTYLCGTKYDAAGAAGFFEKIAASGGSTTPQFLSTHPNPENRVENIHGKKNELNCKGSSTNESEYDRIKSLLP